MYVCKIKIDKMKALGIGWGFFFKRKSRVERKANAPDDFARGFLMFGNVSLSLSYWDVL